MIFNTGLKWIKFYKTAENRGTLSAQFCKKVFQKTKLMFAAFVVAVFCVGAYATTDIQPNGNLSGGSTAANCTQPVLGTYSGSTNFEAKWRANDVSLRWYNEGARITDVQNASKTCTYDGALTIPATAPSRTGYTFGGWKVVPSVPAGYTELEYIEFSGAQWIDTGVVPNQDSRARVEVMATATSSGARTVGGSYGGSSWTDKTFGFYAGATSGILYFNYNTDTNLSDIMQANTKYLFEIDKNKFYINGTWKKTVSSTTFTSLENFRLGMLHLPFSGDRYLIGRIYRFSFWDNGSLVRHLIPVKRNSDNVVGMFDTVNQTFLTNAGSGSLGAGPSLD